MVGAKPSLTIKGISLLLGKYLAGSKVTVNLEVVEKEVEACVVTRAKAKECQSKGDNSDHDPFDLSHFFIDYITNPASDEFLM